MTRALPITAMTADTVTVGGETYQYPTDLGWFLAGCYDRGQPVWLVVYRGRVAAAGCEAIRTRNGASDGTRDVSENGCADGAPERPLDACNGLRSSEPVE